MAYKIFLDTNILLDVAFQRGDNYPFAERVIQHGVDGMVVLFTSSSNLVNFIYFLKKGGYTNREIETRIDELLDLFTILSPDNGAFRDAIHSGFSDLEDAVQYYTAMNSGEIDFFVTSNTKDFKRSIALLPVVTPEKLLKEYFS